MTSVCLAIPPIDETYPWRVAQTGLARLGFEVQIGTHLDADCLVTWSPWAGSRRAHLQAHYEAKDRPVVVMENGWLSPIMGANFYQLACDGWNGTGMFPSGGTERRRKWGISERPWTDREGYALVIGQRGHAHDPRTAAPGWHETLDLGMPVLRRGREATRPLASDLAGASVVHVWTSNAASHAIMAGVPVIQHGPNLMVGAMASRPGEPLFRGERSPELDRLAWAQWTSEELITGEPFARLLAA